MVEPEKGDMGWLGRDLGGQRAGGPEPHCGEPECPAETLDFRGGIPGNRIRQT